MSERRLSRWVVQAARRLTATVALAPNAGAQTTAAGPKRMALRASYQDCAATHSADSERKRRHRRGVLFNAGCAVQDRNHPPLAGGRAGPRTGRSAREPEYAARPDLADLAAAGIPMRMRKSTAPGILHWKMMLFVGQSQVEFSGANSARRHSAAGSYVDYETRPLLTDDLSVVQSS